MSLDHGILNVPLAKRGDIDRQIDAYKRGQAKIKAAAAKSATAQFKLDKAAAKAALAQIIATPDLIKTKAEAMCVSRNLLLDTLDGWSKWEPKRLIALHAKWVPA